MNQDLDEHDTFFFRGGTSLYPLASGWLSVPGDV